MYISSSNCCSDGAGILNYFINGTTLTMTNVTVTENLYGGGILLEVLPYTLDTTYMTSIYTNYMDDNIWFAGGAVLTAVTSANNTDNYGGAAISVNDVDVTLYGSSINGDPHAIIATDTEFSIYSSQVKGSGNHDLECNGSIFVLDGAKNATFTNPGKNGM
jgi:hypothetical protein